MARHQNEITIRCEELEIVTNGELGQQCINSCYLNSFTAAGCLDSRSVSMVCKIRDNQWQRRKILYKTFSLFGS